jgi:hypothetical protein
MRGGPTERPVHLSAHWAETRDQMQAWLIEIEGIDDPRNDPEVTVKFFRAVEPAMRDLKTEAQPDATFRAESNSRSWNLVKGHIRDGVILTETFDFRMIGDPFHIPNVEFDRAKVRLQILPNGELKGFVGGYTPFVHIYMVWALVGTLAESMLSVDLPGFYYALRRLADSHPDPKTGINMNISSTFTIEAVPAFIIPPDQTKISQAAQ